ncbi:hypothetical protein ACFVWZ_22315, partial [Streptomyces sp. NPDC058200]|uniref:hypothetical protein n=1 Tax=Streptomyces sp. NPDC058200 TaxID=3346378 RepID=UPI0036E447D6
METLYRLSYWGEQQEKAYPMLDLLSTLRRPRSVGRSGRINDTGLRKWVVNAEMPRTIRCGAFPQRLFGGVLLSHRVP